MRNIGNEKVISEMKILLVLEAQGKCLAYFVGGLRENVD
jgi:hypothetical protein